MPTRRYLDLSHPISTDMLVNPFMPKPTITAIVDRNQSSSFLAPGVTCQMDRLDVPGNTGTYLNAPFQFHAEAADLARLPLDQLIDVPIVVVAVPDQLEIGAEAFEAAGDLHGTAVLVHTGHDRHWGTTAFFKDSPYLSEAAVKVLAEAGPAIVGIDSHNLDNGSDNRKLAQHRLLGQDVCLLVSVTGLDRLPPRGARLTVLPVPVERMGSFPVRAVAVLDD
jgi:arylformamidase